MRSFAVLVLLLIAHGARATTLYATTTGLVGPRGLYAVSTTTGAATFIDDADDRFWEDITGRPGDGTHLYGVQRDPGSEYLNHVSTIDVTNGNVVDLFSFVPADFGLTSGQALELTGISIAPSQPSIATISAFILELSTPGSTNVVFDLDLGTGAFSDLQTLDRFASDLTHGTGGTLFAVATGSPGLNQAATIDRSTGIVSALGPCAQCAFQAVEYDGLANELLIVNSNGQLTRVSPTTGASLGTIGNTGLGNGVLGLAFVGAVPEPSTGVLVLLGLIGYGIASNGRGGSRGSARRA